MTKLLMFIHPKAGAGFGRHGCSLGFQGADNADEVGQVPWYPRGNEAPGTALCQLRLTNRGGPGRLSALWVEARTACRDGGPFLVLDHLGVTELLPTRSPLQQPCERERDELRGAAP